MNNAAAFSAAFNCEDFLKDDELVFHKVAKPPFIVAGVRPLTHAVFLAPVDGAAFFLQNREAGVVNLGGTGSVSADGVVYVMEQLSCTYLGKGTTDVKFYSSDPGRPAIFLLISTVADFAYPNHMVKVEEATPSAEIEELHALNALTYLRPQGIQSCQLQMGICTGCSGQDFAGLSVPGGSQLACYTVNRGKDFFIWSLVSGSR